jgi:hypothetical protein
MDFSLNNNERARSMIRNKSMIDEGISQDSATRQYRKSPHQPDYTEPKGDKINLNKVTTVLPIDF